MDLTQLSRDELLALRERVATTLEARERAEASATTPETADTGEASGGNDLESLESNLKSELERYQKWMRQHQ